MQSDQRSAGLVLQSMSVHGSYHSPQLPPGLLPAHAASSLAASPARLAEAPAPYSADTLHDPVIHASLLPKSDDEISRMVPVPYVSHAAPDIVY